MSTYPSILSEIQKRQAKNVYLLHGNEPYFIDALCESFENNLLPQEQQAFDQHILYGRDINPRQIMDYAYQIPMAATQKLILIKEAQEMRQIDELQPYAENPSNHTIMVIAFKYKKMDGRSRLVKAIKANGVVFESKKIPDYKLVAWIKTYTKSKKIATTDEACQLLHDYIGSDISTLVNQIKKLSISLNPSQTIDAEMVKDKIGISKQYNIFEYQKALAYGDKVKALKIALYLDQNTKGNPSVLLLAALYRYFVKVFIASRYLNSSDNQLSKVLGLANSFFAKEYKAAASQFGRRELTKIFYYLQEADEFSKGVGTINLAKKALMQDLTMKILRV